MRHTPKWHDRLLTKVWCDAKLVLNLISKSKDKLKIRYKFEPCDFNVSSSCWKNMSGKTLRVLMRFDSHDNPMIGLLYGILCPVHSSFVSWMFWLWKNNSSSSNRDERALNPTTHTCPSWFVHWEGSKILALLILGCLKHKVGKFSLH